VFWTCDFEVLLGLGMGNGHCLVCKGVVFMVIFKGLRGIVTWSCFRSIFSYF
jgi:hypothetical protein